MQLLNPEYELGEKIQSDGQWENTVGLGGLQFEEISFCEVSYDIFSGVFLKMLNNPQNMG